MSIGLLQRGHSTARSFMKSFCGSERLVLHQGHENVTSSMAGARRTGSRGASRGRRDLDIVHDLLIAVFLLAPPVDLPLVLLGFGRSLVEEILAPISRLERLLVVVAVADPLGHIQLRAVVPVSAEFAAILSLH